MAAGLAATVMLLAACSSGPRRGRGGPPGGEVRFEGPQQLAGTAEFFEGTILATVHTEIGGPEGGPGRGENDDRPARSGGGGGGDRPPGGGAMGGMGGMGGPPPGGGGDYGGGMRVGPPARGLGGGPLVRITVRLENRAGAASEVRVIEFKSQLGNFAVRPEVLALNAGAGGDLERMSSRIAVPWDGFPVTLTLSQGGERETQTFELHVPMEEKD